jgi:hypothetical protein
MSRDAISIMPQYGIDDLAGEFVQVERSVKAIISYAAFLEVGQNVSRNERFEDGWNNTEAAFD